MAHAAIVQYLGTPSAHLSLPLTLELQFWEQTESLKFLARPWTWPQHLG